MDWRKFDWRWDFLGSWCIADQNKGRFGGFISIILWHLANQGRSTIDALEKKWV